MIQRQVGRILLIGHVIVAYLNAKKSESCGAVLNNVETGGGWERVPQTGFLKMDSSYMAARWQTTHLAG